MKVLIVEDEAKAGDNLRKDLTENRFVVDLARNGVDNLNLAATGDYTVIVLHVMLPGMNGWSVLRELRKAKDISVIFLTARDEVEDRVKGLKLGADDYLIKPFAFFDLLARLRTLLRRGRNAQAEVLRIADLELDPVRHSVSRGATRIDLTAKEFALLHLLMRRQGDVLSRTFIAEQVWDMSFDSDTNVMKVAVRRLRVKMDDPFDRKLLHTVRGMRYVLEEQE